MQSFISETIEDILKTTTRFENVLCVLPSQRAKVFLKNELKDTIKIGFLPETVTIEQFIEQVSGFQKIETLQLIFQFYEIYKSIEKTPDSFDVFSSWATTVLQDFSEIDQHIINSKDIFVYLRDIQRLKKWSVVGTFKETEFVKDHYNFLEKLHVYYNSLYAILKEKKMGYQGMLYREATNNIDTYLKENHHKKIIFIGFNALNKAEELIFQKTLERGNADIYWDIDVAFYEGSHLAGSYIRAYKKTWKYYEKHSLKGISNQFYNSKKITIVGAPKNNMQVQYASQVISSTPNVESTALVLGDESLLPITLNAIPNNIQHINITMGYSLKNIPATQLITAIFQLHLNQEKLQKTSENTFYYKDVNRFIKQPLLHSFFYVSTDDIVNNISHKISKENIMFVSKDDIISLCASLGEEHLSLLKAILSPFSSIPYFIQTILALIHTLKEDVTAIEKEYLYRFHNIFNQLQNLQHEFNSFEKLTTLHQFFNQLVASESLSFQGEPLKGLQIMGMLETRVLDFETLVLVAANEGVVPSNSQQNSFIPFDVKGTFGLPTYREKDAVYSYHFFRLLQRAKNVYIIYNTEKDTFGSGEKSRFVSQLEMMNLPIDAKIVLPNVTTEKAKLKEIAKDEPVKKQLKMLAEKGISPSALTGYLRDPISFYKQKILHLKEVELVEETVAYNTLGNVIHKTLDALYTPFVGRVLTNKDVAEMMGKTTDMVETFFKLEFKSGSISTGKNKLIFEVAKRFITNFLSQEKKLVSNPNNELRIIATEENLAQIIHIPQIEYPIKIHGQVDRVDELNGGASHHRL